MVVGETEDRKSGLIEEEERESKEGVTKIIREGLFWGRCTRSYSSLVI